MEIDVMQRAARATIDPPVGLRAICRLGPRRAGRSTAINVGVCAVEPVIGHRRSPLWRHSSSATVAEYQRSGQECAMPSILASPSLAFAHKQISDSVAQDSPPL